MDFKSLLSQLDQLNEATEKTKTGLKHTAEPGGYGRKDDEDEEGNKVKAKDTEKKGRGRPKKATSASGEDKKYDFSAFGVKHGKDIKLPKHDKKKTTKHSLKEYFDAIDQEMIAESEAPAEISQKAIDMFNEPNKKFYTKNPHFARGTEIKNIGKTVDASGKPVSALATKVTPKFNKPDPVQRVSRGSFNTPVEEAEQIQIKPASQMPKQPGQTSQPGQQQQVAGQPQKQTQVIAQGNKTLGTVDNPQLAQQIKQSIGKGEMTLMPNQMHEEDIGKHNNATTGFDALVKKLTPKYGVEAAKRIAGAQLKKIREADQPPNDSLLSPIGEGRVKADNKAEKAGKKVTKDLEYDMGHKGKDDAKAEKAGKKVTKDIEYDEKKKTVKEAAKPDFLDLDKDGDKKESMKKAAKDKKKVKEGMEHKLKAARHAGKAHALAKESYNCRYDDMEEARHYHEGYKEGLDECYGQMPIQGYVGETNNEVADMASYGAHTPEVDEGNAFTAALKKTPQGGKFTLGGKTFKDTSNIEESPFAFESLDKQLNALLEGEEVNEGMTVSISKGQQGSPDSVSVTAQDGEADQLLSIIKQAGLGLFGGDDAGQPQATPPMTMDVDGGEGPQADIEVVDDHDDMLSLIRKMTGQGPAAGDYEEEGPSDDGKEETCEVCGESACGCDSEAVEEDETLDQREYEVAEDESGGDDSEESDEVNSDAVRDAALAQAAGKNFADTDAPLEEGGDGGEAGTDAIAADDAADEVNAEEEDLDESYANGDDDTFETDIDFMTKVISGGLNKQKSTGQTTIPVIAGQNDRMGYNTNESVNDWKKLAGIK